MKIYNYCKIAKALLYLKAEGLHIQSKRGELKMNNKYVVVFVLALFLVFAFQGFVSSQGILAPAGSLGMYSVRGLYKFKQEEKWNAYGYGSLGYLQYDYYYGSESSMAFGVSLRRFFFQCWYKGLSPVHKNSILLYFRLEM